MSHWLTYTLSDFLLFSPHTYYRLFELHNEALWPAQLAALAAGGVQLALALRGGVAGSRLSAAILALLWLWVAWSWHWERYATVNWAARYVAPLFALQALLLAGLAVRGPRGETAGFDVTARAGIGILAFAVLLQPLLGPLQGRPWAAAEVFGIAPDPTVAGTVGALFAATRGPPWAFLAIPLLWCALTGATLFAMRSPEAALMPAIGLLAVGLGLWRWRLRRARMPR